MQKYTYLLKLPRTIMRSIRRMLAKIPRTARLKRILASDCGSSLQVIFQLDLDLFGFKKELSSVDLIPGRITVFLCNPSI